MKNLTKEKKERLILIAVGTIVTMVGLYYGVIRAQRDTLEALARKKVDEENRVNSSQRMAATLGELQEKLGTSQQKLKTIESTMASGDMYSWIILTMNSFKENGGYKVEIPQFSREVSTEIGMLAKFPYRAAVFHIRGTAYYHDFCKFVADFENTFPYMRIQNVYLEPAGSSAATALSGGPAVANTPVGEDAEKLTFKMEIVTLVNPNTR